MIDYKHKIITIEGIRGFAATYVMLGHIVMLMQPYIFAPEYKFALKTLFGYGHQAVLLFFIVSGFSIHYSAINQDFNNVKKIKNYFYKRFRRIYPILFIALFFSLIVLCITNDHVSLTRIILSFFMLTDISKGAVIEPIPTNFPIWSLSYEAIYYLIYPLFSVLSRKYGIKKVFAFSFLLSIIVSVPTILGFENHLSNVFNMYWVWTLGALIAEFHLKKTTLKIPLIRSFIIICLALMLTLERALFLSDWFWSAFFGLLFLSFFISEGNSSNSNKLINTVVGSGGLLFAFYLTYSPVVYHILLIRYIILGLGIVLLIIQFISIRLFVTVLRQIIKRFIVLGSFSYAIYILHWPILVLFVYYFKNLISSQILFMLLGILFFIFLVMISSRLLELKLQPKMAKALDRIYYKNQTERAVS